MGEEGQARGKGRGTEKGRVQASQPSVDASAGHSSAAPPGWLRPASYPQHPLPTR